MTKTKITISYTKGSLDTIHQAIEEINEYAKEPRVTLLDIETTASETFNNAYMEFDSALTAYQFGRREMMLELHSKMIYK